MIDRIKDYLWTAAISLAVAFGAWASWSVQKGRVQRAETALSVSQAEVKGLRASERARQLADATREQHRAALARTTKENHVRNETALAANPDWAGGDVPDAVADSLRDAARAANQPRPAQPSAVREADPGTGATSGQAEQQAANPVGPRTPRSARPRQR